MKCTSHSRNVRVSCIQNFLLGGGDFYWRETEAQKAAKYACSRGIWGHAPPENFEKTASPKIESGGFWQLPNTCVQNHRMLIPTDYSIGSI